jgi:hypothetical protein
MSGFMKGACLRVRERRGFRSGFCEMGGFLNGTFLNGAFLDGAVLGVAS